MHKNPNYSKLFRGRPLRFILPLKEPKSNTLSNINLITTNKVYQKLYTINDYLDNKKLHSENRKVNKNNNDINVKCFRKNAAAFRLQNGRIFVKPELLCDLGCETPRINYQSYLGKQYRYFYGISSDVDIENPGTVIILNYYSLYIIS
jgi:carotenoid isomerooxygenase